MNARTPKTSEVLRDPEDQEARLWLNYRVDPTAHAREALCAYYLPFARSIAKRHFFNRSSRDIELPDLCQLAYAGLLEAIDRFSADRATPFKAYAARRIVGSILDGVGKMTELREQITHRNRVRAERARSLSVDVKTTLSHAKAMESLAELTIGLAIGFMLEEAGLSASDDTADSRASAYESADWRDAVGRIKSHVEGLPARDRKIISYHYADGMDFTQIGGLLGISRARVSQLHKTAITQLRKLLKPSESFTLLK